MATADGIVGGCFEAISARYLIGALSGGLAGVIGGGVAVVYDPQVWRGPALQVSAPYYMQNGKANAVYSGRLATGQRMMNKKAQTYQSVQTKAQIKQLGWYTTVVKPAARHSLFGV